MTARGKLAMEKCAVNQTIFSVFGARMSSVSRCLLHSHQDVQRPNIQTARFQRYTQWDIVPFLCITQQNTKNTLKLFFFCLEYFRSEHVFYHPADKHFHETMRVVRV